VTEWEELSLDSISNRVKEFGIADRWLYNAAGELTGLALSQWAGAAYERGELDIMDVLAAAVESVRRARLNAEELHAMPESIAFREHFFGFVGAKWREDARNGFPDLLDGAKEVDDADHLRELVEGYHAALLDAFLLDFCGDLLGEALEHVDWHNLRAHFHLGCAEDEGAKP